MEEVKNNRIWYLDAAKGLGILLISYGHLGVFYTPIMLWGNMFKVTIFWIVIGWLLSRKNIGEIQLGAYAEKRFFQIVVPYFSFGILFALYQAVLNRIGEGVWDFREASNLLTQIILLRGFGTFWFLPPTFFGELYFLFAMKRKNGVSAVVFLFGAAAFLVLHRVLEGKRSMVLFFVPQAVEKAFLAALYIGVGYLAGKLHKVFSSRIQRKTPAILILIVIETGCFALSQKCSGINISSCVFGNHPALMLINAAVIPVGLLYLGSFAENEIGEKASFLLYWGRTSLLMMATQWYIIPYYNQYIKNIFLPYSAGRSLLCFTFFLIFEYGIIELINRNKKVLPFFVGIKPTFLSRKQDPA